MLFSPSIIGEISTGENVLQNWGECIGEGRGGGVYDALIRFVSALKSNYITGKT